MVVSRFNAKKVNPRKTINHEGATAYKVTPELELYSLVCTASLQNKFYESTSETIGRLQELLYHVDPAFVCKLAVYAREQMYLRSIPLVLMVELFKAFDSGIIRDKKRDGALLRRTIARVIGRADEITEVLAYYKLANDRDGVKVLNKLPNALKKGIADAFNKFDEYQFAKYNRKTDVTLKDALFLTHPKAKNKAQQGIFDKLVNNTLEVPETWETGLSAAGQGDKTEEEKIEAKRKVFTDLIVTNKIGYMALLRNLRNILQLGLDEEVMAIVTSRIADPKEVARSKQLPFRFFSAYQSLIRVGGGRGSFGYSSRTVSADIDPTLDPFTTKDVLVALEDAIVESVKNIKGFGEGTRVVIASDVSGSMMKPISPKSTVEQYDIGLLLGQLLSTRCYNAITGFFGDEWKVTDFLCEDKNRVIRNTIQMKAREGEVGYSTNGYKVVEYLNKNNIKTDKVMIFTDCQLWNSNSSYYSNDENLKDEWNTYRKKNPNAKLYIFDLAGYGRMPLDVVADNSVNLIAGFSDKIFDVMDSIEKGEKNLSVIENIVV